MEQQNTIPGVNSTIEGIFGDTEEYKTSGSDGIDKYPEILLQDAQNGYKYYGCYQRHSRQFVNTDASIVRWRNSLVEKLQSRVIEQSFIGPKSKKWSENATGRSYSRPTSSALFSWSSDEAYIQARKRELVIRGHKTRDVRSDQRDQKDQKNKEDTQNDKKEDKEQNSTVLSEPESILKAYNLNLPNKLINDLNYVVDTEANKFIHERIQIMKAHHSEEISKQINERKRRDHELYLQRVKIKEEQYEKELRAATEERDKDKTNKFLGLFGFSHNDSGNSVHEPKRFSFLPKTMFGTQALERDGKEDVEEGVEGEGEDVKDEKEGVKAEKKENGGKDKNEEENGDTSDDTKGKGKGTDTKCTDTRETETKETETNETETKKTVPKGDKDGLKIEKKEPSKHKPPTDISSPSNGPVEPQPIEKLPIIGQQLDLLFSPVKSAFDDEEFDDFQASPPPQKVEKKSVNHRFMPMSEPKPLIDFEDA